MKYACEWKLAIRWANCVDGMDWLLFSFFLSDIMDLEVNGDQTDFRVGSDVTDCVSTGAAAPFRRLSLSVSTDSGT